MSTTTTITMYTIASFDPKRLPPGPTFPRKEPSFDFQNAHLHPETCPSIYECSPEELVDKALHCLQSAGIQLIEWKSLLYRRMGVPVIIRDFHYLVPDAQIDLANKVLTEKENLPLSLPPSLLLNTGGDFYAKGRMYRLTRYTSVALAQHFVIYPASLASYLPTELSLAPRFTNLPTPLSPTILVPTPPAVFASLLRMMASYPRWSPTRITLESDLSELIGYHLYDLQGGYVDIDDDDLCEELEVDKKVSEAVERVFEWRRLAQFRSDEGWIGDSLAAVVGGHGNNIEDLPWALS